MVAVIAVSAILGLAVAGVTTSHALDSGLVPLTLSGGSVSASSSAPGHPARLMTDLHLGTAWLAASPSGSQSVTVDLGSAHAVRASAVTWNLRGGAGFHLSGSSDGFLWTRLGDGRVSLRRRTRQALAGSWRYLRMRIDRPSAGAASIREWRVYVDASDAAEPPPTPSPSATPTTGASATPTPTPTLTLAPTPTPTPTSTLTLAPTPTPTPTPTLPAPSPSPTATAPSVPAGWVYVHDTTIRNLRAAGMRDTYFWNVTFTGGSATAAVIEFNGAASNVIFDHCTVATGGGWNGVSINDTNGDIHDVTFRHVLFKSQGRMGIEITSRPTTAPVGYRNVSITDSTFEPQGSEAVSYDGGPGAGRSSFSGNVIQGAGVNPAQEFGAGFEVNGPSDMTVTGNTIYQSRGPAWNLQRHVTAPSGWVFSGNLLDASHHVQAVPMSALAQVVGTCNVYGGRFDHNTVIADAPGGSVAYIDGSHDMDWRTTTWHDARGGGYARPKEAAGSSGNLW